MNNLSTKKQDIAICATFKNEAPYILEWIAYHRVIKVDHFLIYNNDSNDETSEILQSLDRAGIITYINWPSKPNRNNQIDAYRDACQKLRGKCEWIAFIDADEFIVPNNYNDLKSFLSDYEDVAGIVINWKLFGSSGHISKTDGLVMERFKKCALPNSNANRSFKTIAKTDFIQDVINVHYCTFSKDRNSIYVYPDRTFAPQLSEIKERARQGKKIGSHINHDIIQINHYFTKSKAEWDLKRARGRATIKLNSPEKIRPESIFYSHDKNEAEDVKILRFLEKTKQQIKFLTEVAGLEPIVTKLSSKNKIQTLKLEWLEPHDKIILEIERLYLKNSDWLSGFAIDSPKAEIQYDANSIPIRGWVLGKNSRAVNVKVSCCGDRVLAQTPVKNARPDVAKVHPQVPEAGKSGFATTVSLVGIPSNSELVIEAILEDGSCISIAKLRQDNQVARQQHVMRVFVCGFPKSGTSSLHNAFQSVGWKPAHHLIVPENKYVGELIYQAVNEGKPPFEYLKRYDCISQADVCLPSKKLNYWPQLDINIIDQIYKYYPECIFLLNTRSIGNLISSINKWGNLRHRLIQSEIPGLPRGVGRKDSELEEWIEGHYTKLREFFQGSNRFIEFNIENDDISKLENKLGTSFNWWGMANKNDPTVNNRFRNLSVPEPTSTGVIMQKSGDLPTFKTYVDDGIALKKEGNFDSAIEKLSTALQLKPNSIRVLNHLAEIDESRKEFEQAITYLQRVIKLKPNDGIAYARMAKVMMAQKNIQGAIANYQKAIALQPEQPAWVYIGLGDGLNQTGQIDEAIAAYQKAIALQPKNPAFYVKQSQMYFQKAQIDTEKAQAGLIDKAIEKAQEALQIEPDFVPALEQLALIYESRKQFFAKKLIELRSKQRQLKAKDKWILLHKKSTLKDFSQELKRIKSEELNSIIEGDNYSLFNCSEIHNLSKLSQNFSSSALELFATNLKGWFKREYEDARFKECTDKKALSFISPYTGETVYTCKSLLINLQVVVYIFACNNGIFYWALDNAGHGDFVYIPEIGAIIFGHKRLDNKKVASMVNELKKYIIKNKEEFCTYIESEAETKLYISIRHGRPFHYLFDRLGGLTYLESCGLLDKIGGFIDDKSTNYFEPTKLFPKISAKELIRIEGSKQEKALVPLQKLIFGNNGFVYFIRRLNLKNINPEYFLSAAESSRQEIETLPSFIVRKPKFTVNSGENIVDLLESHHPLVWIGIAIEKRHWIEQVEGINAIIGELSKEFPNIGIIIDGMMGNDNQIFDIGNYQKLYEKETQILSEIIIKIPQEIGVYSTIGMNARHKLFIAKKIDFFITQIGTQALLPSFMAKKPGILHGPPGMMGEVSEFNNYYDINTAILIDKKDVEVKESAEILLKHRQNSNRACQSYSLDWHIIYKEVKEQILPNLSNKSNLSIV